MHSHDALQLLTVNTKDPWYHNSFISLRVHEWVKIKIHQLIKDQNWRSTEYFNVALLQMAPGFVCTLNILEVIEVAINPQENVALYKKYTNAKDI